MFITFEGGDGSGKTTQIKNLSEYLNRHGINHTVTREPGGTHFSEELRNLFLNDNYNLNNLSEYMLINAARVDHVDKKINPSLNRGSWVICDRYIDSTWVYQRYLTDDNDIKKLDKYIEPLFPKPDITFILDCDISTISQRINNRSPDNTNRLDIKSLIFHNKVREGFREVYNNNKERCYIIDGNRNASEIFKDIKSIIKNKINVI